MGKTTDPRGVLCANPQRVKEAREAAGLSQAGLDQICGWRPGRTQSIEAGREYLLEGDIGCLDLQEATQATGDFLMGEDDLVLSVSLENIVQSINHPEDQDKMRKVLTILTGKRRVSLEEDSSG